MRYLVTGGAGFVGSHIVDALLARDAEVICVDNFNDYYAPARKRRNIAAALMEPGFTLIEADIRDSAALKHIFEQHRPERVAHLAAMAGPRPSLQQPELYEEVNVRGTLNILEAARRFDVQGLVFASTSSVYGASPTPWVETLAADRPLSPYAATKRAAEMLAYTYHNEYGTPTRVVRFFTVYGRRGRPDMTPYLFVDAMMKGQPLTLFNGGKGVYRDWTHSTDIVAGVLAALDADYPFEVFNLGNSSPTELQSFIEMLEAITGRPAIIEARPLPAADPPITFANIDKARQMLGFAPKMALQDGLQDFWEWYRSEVLNGI